MNGLMRRAESGARSLEIFLGASLLCFGGAVVLSSYTMSFLLGHSSLLPSGPEGLFLVTIVHDIGYLVLSVLGSAVVSRVVESGRWRLALLLLLPNYVYEEIISYMSGSQGVYWGWPWGFSGRVLIIALAIAASILVQRRSARPKSAV